MGLEFGYALWVMALEQTVPERVRLVGEADKLATLALSHAMSAAMMISALRLMKRQNMLLNACGKGLHFGPLISNCRIY
jgi:hypothetical protein